MIFHNIYTFKELESKIEKVVNVIINGNTRKLSNQELYILTTFDNIIENIVTGKIEKRKEKIKELTTIGHGYINYYGEKLSKGCEICLFGKGLNAIRSASECNLRCSFCYYNNNHHISEKLQKEHFIIDERITRIEELKIAIDKQKDSIDAVTWVYKEPFTEIEKHYEPIKYIKDAGLYQWMYTNGTLCTKENLNKLAEAGLNELRFDLAATNSSDYVISMMEYASTVFETVGIESPMYKEYYDSFLLKKEKIINSGISFINCAELHHSANNLDQIIKDLDNMYIYKFGYVSPMDSREYTYDLIELAIKEEWKNITIHDCSNQTKVYRGYNTTSSFGVLNYAEKDSLPPEWYLVMLKKYKKDLFAFLDKKT